MGSGLYRNHHLLAPLARKPGGETCADLMRRLNKFRPNPGTKHRDTGV